MKTIDSSMLVAVAIMAAVVLTTTGKIVILAVKNCNNSMGGSCKF